MNFFTSAFLYFLNQPIWLILAKLVLSFILLFFAALALSVLLRAKNWYEDLVRLEHQALRARDDAMFDFMATRAALDAFRQRLLRKAEPVGPQFNDQIFKHFGSLAMLILRKERSVFHWGILGAKMARSLYDAFTKE